jgi:receptor expression-enhancing protein 5/6
MDTLPPAVQDKLKKLRSKLDEIPLMQQAEEVTKVPKEYLVTGGAATVFLLIFFSIGAGSICSIVGFAYPAYKSFEAKAQINPT